MPSADYSDPVVVPTTYLLTSCILDAGFNAVHAPPRLHVGGCGTDPCDDEQLDDHQAMKVFGMLLGTYAGTHAVE